MGLQAALHNDDQWMILNATAGMALGPVGAAAAVVSSAVTKYGIDYFRRQTEWAYESDQSKNFLGYIRYGDKWVPAIISDIKEPTEAATFMNIKGVDQNWEGATTLMVHTGYGLTQDEQGNYKFLRPGRDDRMIARKDDLDWHGGQTLQEVESWKPWTNIYVPKSEDKQRELMETGMNDSVAARPLGEIYAEPAISSNR